jgi:hypothetical protein
MKKLALLNTKLGFGGNTLEKYHSLFSDIE